MAGQSGTTQSSSGLNQQQEAQQHEERVQKIANRVWELWKQELRRERERLGRR